MKYSKNIRLGKFNSKYLTKDLFIFHRAIIVAAFCLGTCFDMLFAWMPTYFHDNYPDSEVLCV